MRKSVLDNGMMVRELEGSGANAGNSVATYFQGASGPVYRRDDTQSTQPIAWYVYDGLGSVACELKPDGTVAGRRKVDAYGITRSTAGTGGKQGFVGQLGHTTDETGLIYMRARHYDPQTGRFQSQDPAYHGTNWFAYCDGNPVNRVDTNGKQWTNWLFAFGFALLFEAIYDIHQAGTTDRLYPREIAKHLALANANAAAAAMAFAAASIGLSNNAAWYVLIPGSIEVMLAYMVAETALTATSAAWVAVAATFAYGVMVTGYLIASGILESDITSLGDKLG